jgi:hypothetical protein
MLSNPTFLSEVVILHFLNINIDLYTHYRIMTQADGNLPRNWYQSPGAILQPLKVRTAIGTWALVRLHAFSLNNVETEALSCA